MVLVNFVTVLVLRILGNLVSLQNILIQITADVSTILKIVQHEFTFTLNVFLESSIHFV